MSTLILASGSATRRALLQGAGLAFEVAPAEIDEGAVTGAPEEVARGLARRKALAVSAERRDALVIGGDQVLALPEPPPSIEDARSSEPPPPARGGKILHKAHDAGEARDKLAALAGRTHALHCAVAVAQGGAVVWEHLSVARMTMRALTDAEIDRYLAAAGPEVTASVGAYALEGLGAWLFDRVEGDYFTVLGLPLLPLLRTLRVQHEMGP